MYTRNTYIYVTWRQLQHFDNSPSTLRLLQASLIIRRCDLWITHVMLHLSGIVTVSCKVRLCQTRSFTFRERVVEERLGLLTKPLQVMFNRVLFLINFISNITLAHLDCSTTRDGTKIQSVRLNICWPVIRAKGGIASHSRVVVATASNMESE